MQYNTILRRLRGVHDRMIVELHDVLYFAWRRVFGETPCVEWEPDDPYWHPIGMKRGRVKEIRRRMLYMKTVSAILQAMQSTTEFACVHGHVDQCLESINILATVPPVGRSKAHGKLRRKIWYTLFMMAVYSITALLEKLDITPHRRYMDVFESKLSKTAGHLVGEGKDWMQV